MNKPSGFALPLYLQVVIGVAAGALLGVLFGTESYGFNLLSNAALGQLGQLVIRLLKALAAPLVFFAILDAMINTDISLKHGRRLLALCSINLAAAMIIGLTLMNTLRPGHLWEGRLTAMTNQLDHDTSRLMPKPVPENLTLDPLKNLAGYIPKSLAEPFVDNNMIAIILLALLFGGAIRQLKRQTADEDQAGLVMLEKSIGVGCRLLIQMLLWVVKGIPFAVFGVVAQVVGKAGLEVFELVAVFLAAMLSGLLIHALVYYPGMVKWGGRMPVKRYFSGGADAIVTGLSTNSSLATMPITLRCLTENMGISNRSARLSVCIGTNLNNDGIILYEAMAALFLAQAIGIELNFAQQLVIITAAIMVGVGISGIPEAGLIALPLVLSTAGLPETLVVTAVPLITTIDWIIARFRSGVNVMNDMLIAILLDRLDKRNH
ncbi:dicarboxylate/amino acid:cation symporter [Methylomicrobium sp. RS1]|uniref:dicarboxylate/amino acid:cation symporter n=1 Tax=Candidatus Methylomicrobium oryzae TaxID=2802053 RepID=UPI001924AFD6|nr:dicarboxylate/amino acid:cation symporter [Methylomicrobium sp. RS1]MBL1264147.1 dicarboxylate/amino acid:cation symporter [Methylomicrobium sp. RS1]